jgi:hypothetical protein
MLLEVVSTGYLTHDKQSDQNFVLSFICTDHLMTLQVIFMLAQILTYC